MWDNQEYELKIQMGQTQRDITNLSREIDRLSLSFNKLGDLSNLDKNTTGTLSNIGKAIDTLGSRVTKLNDSLADGFSTAGVGEYRQEVGKIATELDSLNRVVSILAKNQQKLREEVGTGTQQSKILNEQVVSHRELSNLYGEELRIQKSIAKEYQNIDSILKSRTKVVSPERRKELEDYMQTLKYYREELLRINSITPTNRGEFLGKRSAVDELTKGLREHAIAVDTVADSYMKSSFSSTDWLANIGKRAVAYYGVYQIIQMVIDGLKDELRYIYEIDTASRTLAAIANFRGTYNDRLEQGIALESQLVGLAKTYGGELKDINSAAMELTRAGTPTEKINEATRATMLLARLTGDTIATSASAMVTYVQVYSELAATQGKASYSVEQIADKLAYLANQSRMTTQDIGTFSNYALATATNVGLSIDAINGMAISLSNAGFNASTVGTQIRKFASLLNSSSSEVTHFFEAMGMSQGSLAEAIAQGGDASNEAFTQMLQRMSSISSAEFNKIIANLDLLERNVLVSLRANASEVISQMSGSINESAGQLDKAKLITEGYQASLERLKATMRDMFQGVVEPLVKSFNVMALSVVENEGTLRHYWEVTKVLGGALVNLADYLGVVKVATIAFAKGLATAQRAIDGVALVLSTLGITTFVKEAFDEVEKQLERTKQWEDAQYGVKIRWSLFNAEEIIKETVKLSEAGDATEEVLKNMAVNIKAQLDDMSRLTGMSSKEIFTKMFAPEDYSKLTDASKKAFDAIAKELKIGTEDLQQKVFDSFSGLMTDKTLAEVTRQFSKVGTAITNGLYLNTNDFQYIFTKNEDVIKKHLGDVQRSIETFVDDQDTRQKLQEMFVGFDTGSGKLSGSVQEVTKRYEGLSKVLSTLGDSKGIDTLRKQIDMAYSAEMAYANGVTEADKKVKENKQKINEEIKKQLEQQYSEIAVATNGDKLAMYEKELEVLKARKKEFADSAVYQKEENTIIAKLNKERDSQALDGIKQRVLANKEEYGDTVEFIQVSIDMYRKLIPTLSDYEAKKQASANLSQLEIDLSKKQKSALDNELKLLMKTQETRLALLEISNDEAEARRQIAIAQEKAQGNNTAVLSARNTETTLIEEMAIGERKLADITERRIKLSEILSAREHITQKDILQFGADYEKLTLEEQKAYVEKLKNEAKLLEAVKARRDTEIEYSDSFVDGWLLANERFLKSQKTLAQEAMDVHSKMVSSMTQGFTDFFDSNSEGFLDMRSLAKKVLKDILAEVTRIALVKPMVSGIMGMFGGGLSGLSGVSSLVGTTVSASEIGTIMNSGGTFDSATNTITTSGGTKLKVGDTGSATVSSTGSDIMNLVNTVSTLKTAYTVATAGLSNTVMGGFMGISDALVNAGMVNAGTGVANFGAGFANPFSYSGASGLGTVGAGISSGLIGGAVGYGTGWLGDKILGANSYASTGGLAGGALGGIGASLGLINPVLGILGGSLLGSAIGGIFGKKKVTDTGIQFFQNMDTLDTLSNQTVRAYQDWQKKGWFSSSSGTEMSDLSANQMKQIEAVFDTYDYLLVQLGDSDRITLEAGKYSGETFANALTKNFITAFTDVNQSLDSTIYDAWVDYAESVDKTVTEALQESINTFITEKRTFEIWALGDSVEALAKKAQFAQTDFNNLEKSLGVSGVTVENYLSLYEDAVKNSFDANTIANWASLGDALMTATDAQKTYTDAVKAQEDTLKSANETIRQNMLSALTTTINGWLGVLSSINSAINNITPTFKTFSDLLHTTVTLDNYSTLLSDLENTRQNEIKTSTDASELRIAQLEKEKEYFTELMSYVDDLTTRIGGSTASYKMSYQESLSNAKTLLASGKDIDVSSITEKATQYLDSTLKGVSSQRDYLFEVAKVRRELTSFGASLATGGSLAGIEQAIAQEEATLATKLDTINQTALAILASWKNTTNAELNTANTKYLATSNDTIQSAYTNILGRTADTAGYQYWSNDIATGAVKPSDITKAISIAAIDEIYRTVLGREADAAGKAYWISEIERGKIAPTDIDEAIRNAAVVNGSHANGLNYVPFDGYKAELHEGERVLTSEDNKGFSSELTAIKEESVKNTQLMVKLVADNTKILSTLRAILSDKVL